MKKLLRKYKFKIAICITIALVITIIFALFSVDNLTNTMNIEFIRSFGWETENAPKDISHVTIPDELNSLYIVYSDIASIPGESLYDYCGKNLTRYSYTVTNHNLSGTGKIRANVFVYKSKIVAADISNLTTNGNTTSISDTTDKIE